MLPAMPTHACRATLPRANSCMPPLTLRLRPSCAQERADKATAYNLMWSLPAGPDSWPESPSAPEDGPAWLQVTSQPGHALLGRSGVGDVGACGFGGCAA